MKFSVLHRKGAFLLFVINNILSLLEEKGLKQADLCEAIRISSSTMTNWKNRGTDPPAKHIIPICEFLNVSPYLLLTGKEATDDINEAESKLLSDFRILSQQGQEYIQQQMFMAKEVYKKADISDSEVKAG